MLPIKPLCKNFGIFLLPPSLLTITNLARKQLNVNTNTLKLFLAINTTKIFTLNILPYPKDGLVQPKPIRRA